MNLVYPRLKEQPYFGKNIRKHRGYKPGSWRCETATIAFLCNQRQEDNCFYDRRRSQIQKLLENRASNFFGNMVYMC